MPLGFAKLLRVQRSADARVLKAQLDLVAESMSITRVSAVLWSLALLGLTTSVFGVFGNVPIARGIWLPVAVSVSSILAAIVVSQFRRDSISRPSYDDISRWQSDLIFVQAGIGTIWGFAPWLLWQGGSALNHLFLAGAMVVALANFVVSRANHSGVILAGIVPVAGLSALRFALGDGSFDYAIAVVLPLIALQLYRDGRRMTLRMDQDSRLRFQVEDLARELEETRDEALRKRFEAETANASKTAFLANMSHELRTPLNAILGFSEIIAQECFGPVGSPRYREYAGDIHASGAHLLSLINDLLDVAKIEAGKMEIQPQPFDARQAFDIALKLIAAKAREKRQDLSIEIDSAAPTLYADERALKQILINLVSNAVKFTHEGGRISVVGSPARDGGFQIAVRDNGPGISREKLDKIFSPFNQVDNRYDRQAGGTGLGLALVRGLAELHGGRAWLESEPGRGCAAFVVLPPPPNAKTSGASQGDVDAA
jgi:two-component system, cell cycle sensor histidine kinase PleC